MASHTTLLTNLANRLQPLIRYDLGDSVTMLPGSCPCGSRLPGIRPEGRRDEILRVALPGGGTRPLLPLVLATVLEEAPGLLRYQLVQSGPRSLKLRVEEAAGFDRPAVCADALRRLGAHLRSRGDRPGLLALSDERPESAAAGGKERRFLVADGLPPEPLAFQPFAAIFIIFSVAFSPCPVSGATTTPVLREGCDRNAATGRAEVGST